ncbi:MAG: hypothetical protein KGL39_33890 [Patescibacteria group bacterium]|nr:hypothetical protein [Patescibacteria group bacterium]
MRRKKETAFETPSKRHVSTTVTNEKANKLFGNTEKKDPIQAKNEEIAKEKARSEKKTGIKANDKVLFETKTYLEEDTNPLNYITMAVKEYFKLDSAIFKDWMTRWDFPKDTKEKTKRHKVWRHYCQETVNILVDAFDKKTPISEINRIKAHLESIGFKYTYFVGGESYADENGRISDEFKKLLFVTRLKPLDKSKMKMDVPQSLEEAGVNQVLVQG